MCDVGHGVNHIAGCVCHFDTEPFLHHHLVWIVHKSDDHAGPLFATDSEEEDRSRACGRPIR